MIRLAYPLPEARILRRQHG